MSSLEGYRSTVELHPHVNHNEPGRINDARRSSLAKSIMGHSPFIISQWGVKDLNLRRHCHQIYSLTPLTARETPLSTLHPSRILAELICPTRLPRLPAFRAVFRTKNKGFPYELAEGLEPTTC